MMGHALIENLSTWKVHNGTSTLHEYWDCNRRIENCGSGTAIQLGGIWSRRNTNDKLVPITMVKLCLIHDLVRCRSKFILSAPVGSSSRNLWGVWAFKEFCWILVWFHWISQLVYCGKLASPSKKRRLQQLRLFDPKQSQMPRLGTQIRLERLLDVWHLCSGM